MPMKLGSILIELDGDTPVDDLSKLTLEDLLKLGVTLRWSTMQGNSHGKPDAIRRPQAESIYSQQVTTLKKAGFSDKTIVMIGRKILGLNSSGKNLDRDFGVFESAATKFTSREITEPVWAIFAASVNLQHFGNQTCVLGLTEKNQLTVLSIQVGSNSEIFKDLISRGINPDKIKIGVLSFHLDAIAEFKKYFPKAKAGLDWTEYVDLTIGPMNKLKVKQAMISKEKSEVQAVVKELKAPKELLSFLDFPPKLWRVLRATTAIQRVEKDLRHRLGTNKTKEEYELLLAWCLIRLQYHWDKIPVDADQLYNLRYLQDA